MTTKTELQARVDAITAWMDDPATRERRALWCLVTKQGLWLVPKAYAQFNLGIGVDDGFSAITVDSFEDAHTFKDHNHANKRTREWNQVYGKNTAEIMPMRVGDALAAAAKAYAKRIAEAKN